MKSFRELDEKNVLITNAGKGTRVRSIAKCLVKIGNETILERQLRILKNQGINKIVVAVSDFHGPRIMKRVPNVEYVQVPYIGTWDLASIFACKFMLYNTWILQGDAVFTEKALKEIMDVPFENLLFIGRKHRRCEIFRYEQLSTITNCAGGQMIRQLPQETFNLKIHSSWDLLHYFEKATPEKVKFYEPHYFITDIDFPLDIEIVRKCVEWAEYGDRESECQLLDGETWLNEDEMLDWYIRQSGIERLT